MKELEEIKNEYQDILDQIKKAEKSLDWKELGRLNKEKELLEKILQKQNWLQKIETQIEETNQIIKTEGDSQLISLAEEERSKLLQEKEKIEKEIKEMIHNKNSETEEPESIIVEIRAGAGGDEAALFAADLFNMYSKYADSKHWKLKVLDSHKTDLGGLKEIVFELTGSDVYSKMKYEGGVHRVQRIPATEKSGRIHTSTASVAILPRPRKKQIEIRPDDLKIETFRASGPGGQYVNRRETAVRITHLPTGIVVASQSQRNQAANKETALSILAAKLLELQTQKANEKLQEKRKSQVGRMERSEKIRTYNFPQDRVTDHRIKKTWHNIEKIMSGELDPIIEELEKTYK